MRSVGFVLAEGFDVSIQKSRCFPSRGYISESGWKIPVAETEMIVNGADFEVEKQTSQVFAIEEFLPDGCPPWSAFQPRKTGQIVIVLNRAGISAHVTLVTK